MSLRKMSMASSSTSLLLCMLLFVLCHLSTPHFNGVSKPYTPDWASLDSRPIPNWFKDAKFGIFMHWGVFSVTNTGRPDFELQLSEGSAEEINYFKNYFAPGMTYTDLCSLFTARYFNASQWIEILENAGAKYVVPISKHIDGFCNWNTSYSERWNSVQCGPKRDLIGELEAAVRKSGQMKFGVYHGMRDILSPVYQRDLASNFTTNEFIATKTTPQLHELVMNYRPDLIWSDDDFAADWHYWNSTNFLAWLYNDSPVKDTVVVNDRWGRGSHCHHGGYITCQDDYNPRRLQSRHFECCHRAGSTWAYNKHDQITDIMTPTDALTMLIQVVSCGGNLLLNIAPTHDGLIMPVFQHLLSEMGMYLARNGEAIYSSTPWTTQHDMQINNVWYTQQPSTKAVYACITEQWPGRVLELSAPVPSINTTITLLGYDGPPLKWVYSNGNEMMRINMPILGPDTKIKHGWVLKLTYLKNY